ncbi:MAG: WXG100 family type VII secretion target [Erysipelotrichaceae bacterium]
MQISLKVQPEILTSKASEINAEKTAITGIMEQVKGEMNSLVGSWKSSSSDEYQAKFKQLYNDMENVFVILTEYINDLNEAASVYSAAESSAKAIIEGLPVDGVFKS